MLVVPPVLPVPPENPAKSVHMVTLVPGVAMALRDHVVTSVSADLKENPVKRVHPVPMVLRASRDPLGLLAPQAPEVSVVHKENEVMLVKKATKVPAVRWVPVVSVESLGLLALRVQAVLMVRPDMRAQLDLRDQLDPLEPWDLLETKVPQVEMDKLARLATLDHLDLLGLPENKDVLVSAVRSVLKDIQAFLVPKVLGERWDLRAILDKLVSKVLLVLADCQDLGEGRDQLVNQVPTDPRVAMEIAVQLVRPVKRALVVLR